MIWVPIGSLFLSLQVPNSFAHSGFGDSDNAPDTPSDTHSDTAQDTSQYPNTLPDTPLQSKEVFGVWHSQTPSFSIKKREDDGMLEARLLQESSGASMPQFALVRILNLENFSLWN